MDLLVFAGAVACFASGILAYKLGWIREDALPILLLVVTSITFPAAAFTSIAYYLPFIDSTSAAIFLLAGFAAAIVPSAAVWLGMTSRAGPRRAQLSALAAGGEIGLVGLPLAELVGRSATSAGGSLLAAFTCLMSLSAMVTSRLLSFGLHCRMLQTVAEIAKARREHVDGGQYDGEWVWSDSKAQKAGHGVYVYPAKSDGQWERNLKHGYGVYVFSNGGNYQGEWRNGQKHGIGLRTYSDGRMTYGQWKNGKMVRKGLAESPALSRVVQSAVKAAAYADSRAEMYATLRTPMTTALQELFTFPPVALYILVLGLVILGLRFPSWTVEVAYPFCQSHGPLSLFFLGAFYASVPRLQSMDRKDLNVFLGIRIGVGLILGGLAYLLSKNLLVEAEFGVAGAVLLAPMFLLCTSTMHLELCERFEGDIPLAQSAIAAHLPISIAAFVLVSLPNAQLVLPWLPVIGLVMLGAVGILLVSASISSSDSTRPPQEPSSDLDTGPKTATEADGSSQQQQQQLENKTSGEGGERGEGGGGERRSQQPPPTALHHVPHDRSLLRSTSPGRLSHFGTRLSVRSSPVIRPLRVSSAKRKACGAVRHPRLKSASLCR